MLFVYIGVFCQVTRPMCLVDDFIGIVRTSMSPAIAYLADALSFHPIPVGDCKLCPECWEMKKKTPIPYNTATLSRLSDLYTQYGV